MKIINGKLKSHFLNLYIISLSDSTFDPKERELLYNIGLERGLIKSEIDFITKNPHRVRFYKPKSIYEKFEHLFDFARMILADGIIDPREIDVFSTLAKKLEFNEEIIPELIDIFIDEVKKNTFKDEIFKIIKQKLKIEN